MTCGMYWAKRRRQRAYQRKLEKQTEATAKSLEQLVLDEKRTRRGIKFLREHKRRT